MSNANTTETAGTAAGPRIIGHQAIIDYLQRAWERQRVAHAFLLSGPEGIGKLAVAEWFAGLILDQPKLAAHPDYAKVERGNDPKTGKPRNSISIEQVHCLRGQLALGSMAGGWKVAVLDGADQLNEAAANALLKTLEEPHPKTVLLLTAASAEAVMGTIRSRCQIIRLNRVPREEITAGLQERGLSDEQADRLSRLSGGRPGQAISLAENPDRLEAFIQQRNRMLELAASQLTERWLGLEELVPNKTSFNEQRQVTEQELGLLAELLRDAWWLQEGLADRLVHADCLDGLKRVTTRHTRESLKQALELVDASRRRLNANLSPKTAVGLVASGI